MAHAMAQTDTVYAGQSSVLNVVEVPGDTYTWELYDNVTGVDFVAIPGNCLPAEAYFTGGINTGAAVNVTWLLPGTYFFKVTAVRPGCTNNLKVGRIVVRQALPTATLEQPPPICIGETAILNVVLTGTAPWSIDVTDGTKTTTYDNIAASPFAILVSPTVTTSYTVTRVKDARGLNLILSNTVTLIVKPRAVTSPIIQYGPK
jgi:hypothetical protein